MGQPLVPHLGYRQDNINLFNIKRTQGGILQLNVKLSIILTSVNLLLISWSKLTSIGQPRGDEAYPLRS